MIEAPFGLFVENKSAMTGKIMLTNSSPEESSMILKTDGRIVGSTRVKQLVWGSEKLTLPFRFANSGCIELRTSPVRTLLGSSARTFGKSAKNCIYSSTGLWSSVSRYWSVKAPAYWKKEMPPSWSGVGRRSTERLMSILQWSRTSTGRRWSKEGELYLPLLFETVLGSVHE